MYRRKGLHRLEGCHDVLYHFCRVGLDTNGDDEEGSTNNVVPSALEVALTELRTFDSIDLYILDLWDSDPFQSADSG